MPIEQSPPKPRVIVAVPRMPAITFIPARFRRQPRRESPIWIVLHCTHGAEGKRKAEDLAAELRDCPANNPRSIHWGVDTDSIVQCVLPTDEAWHAGRTANLLGEGIELCGRADQTVEQWFDADSLPMLQLAARLVRWRCDTLGLPLVPLTAADLRSRKRGITTHANVAQAFPTETNHWDPGPGFPLHSFLRAVQLA